MSFFTAQCAIVHQFGNYIAAMAGTMYLNTPPTSYTWRKLVVVSEVKTIAPASLSHLRLTIKRVVHPRLLLVLLSLSPSRHVRHHASVINSFRKWNWEFAFFIHYPYRARVHFRLPKKNKQPSYVQSMYTIVSDLHIDWV